MSLIDYSLPASAALKFARFCSNVLICSCSVVGGVIGRVMIMWVGSLEGDDHVGGVIGG